MDQGKCESCGADVLWAITAKGKRCCYDVTEVEDSKEKRVYAYQPDSEGKMQRVEPGAKGHQNHFGTCPNAAHHSKKS